MNITYYLIIVIFVTWRVEHPQYQGACLPQWYQDFPKQLLLLISPKHSSPKEKNVSNYFHINKEDKHELTVEENQFNNPKIEKMYQKIN